MSHDHERLQAALAELKLQLASLENVDPAVQQRLRQTIAEIELMLAEPTAERPAHPASFTERLSNELNHFEESHPNLAGMLGSVIDALARMGI